MKGRNVQYSKRMTLWYSTSLLANSSVAHKKEYVE